MLPAAS